jgi:hypothetical protein
MRLLVLIFTIHMAIFAGSSDVRVAYYGKMYRHADESSSLVQILDDSCRLRVLGETAEWLEVQSGGYRGWVKKSVTTWEGESVAQRAPDTEDSGSLLSLLALAAVLGAVALLALVLLLSKRKKGEMRSDLTISTKAVDHQEKSAFNLLVFADTDRNIRSIRSNVHKRLSTCFREIGFAVHFIESLKPKRQIIPFKISLIAVDYRLNKKAPELLEEILTSWGISPTVPVFFYNIPREAFIVSSTTRLSMARLRYFSP